MKTRIITIVALLSFIAASAISQQTKEYGVYEYVVRKAQGSFEQITSDLQSAAVKAGWKVLATVDAGQINECSFKARVFVLHHAHYAKQILSANNKTGPFAALDRMNLFEDEDGLHISVVNPHSINRTVLMEDEKYEAMTEEHLQTLRTMITSVVKGEESKKQYGEMRDRGFIGKTMGVVAGGSFDGKVEDAFVIPTSNVREIADKVEQGLKVRGKEWGTHHVFTLALPEFETVIFGTTGTPLDTKSFDIVGAGDDDARDDFKCAGLAHAAAYPLEVVVVKEGNEVKVRMVHAMFRMKMFFEDAGKWAFMKHMGMPGSIADEIEAQITSALALQTQ